ncbi:MAG: fused MFS/spermidine synthase [Thermoanaerobaculia bacterium]
MLAPFRFYWVVAVSGAIFMAFEILSSRILAPHFGSSVYVWGSIISIFLAALSLGYAWGGRLADRQPRMPILGRLITFAAVFQAVLLLWGVRLAGLLADLTGGSPAGTLLAASVLFGPTSILFGTVSPYAVRLAARDLAQVGNTAGRLYALSTLGSLAGTLVCTFVLIPFLELHQILGLLLGLTALTGGLALVEQARAERPALALAVALAVLAGVGVAGGPRAETGVLLQRITPYQSLRVLEGQGKRTLQSDRINQGAVQLADGEPGLTYPRYAAAALLMNPEIRSLLVLGMGSGSVGSYLQRRLPELRVDYVEIDPAIPELARRFLLFRDNALTRIEIADGRRFLSSSGERWDYIYCDAYIGHAIPFHLTTIEFMRTVREHLTPEGIFGFNISGNLDLPFPQAIYRTVAAAFPFVTGFAVAGSDNHLLLGVPHTSWVPEERLVERGRELDRRWSFDPPLAEVARRRIAVDLELSEIPALSDAYAPVEYLVLVSSEVPTAR